MPERKLAAGKIPKEILSKLVFTCLGVPSERVLKGPKIGEDAALIDMGEKILIAKANPITGAENKIGWLAVHINANDVAARGAKPLWYLSIILLPVDAPESLLETIMKEQHEACCELGVSIVGGHTEVAPGLKRPIVSGFMLGEVNKDSKITTDGAQIGDKIILTKGVGIEGTGILASDLRAKLLRTVDVDLLNRAVKMLDMISVVPEAMEASTMGCIRSMHTPTEGGVLNGLLEISEASGLGFRVYKAHMTVHKETRVICDALDVDPLKLLSSGSLLMSVSSSKADDVVQRLHSIGVESSVIGEIIEKGTLLVDLDGVEHTVNDIAQDELFRILESE